MSKESQKAFKERVLERLYYDLKCNKSFTAGGDFTHWEEGLIRGIELCIETVKRTRFVIKEQPHDH